jgi:hypothetical protein
MKKGDSYLLWSLASVQWAILIVSATSHTSDTYDYIPRETYIYRYSHEEITLYVTEYLESTSLAGNQLVNL